MHPARVVHQVQRDRVQPCKVAFPSSSAEVGRVKRRAEEEGHFGDRRWKKDMSNNNGSSQLAGSSCLLCIKHAIMHGGQLARSEASEAGGTLTTALLER